MTINNPTYRNHGLAAIAARKAALTNPGYKKREDDLVELQDRNRPLYNDAARCKSAPKVRKGAVARMWDLCFAMADASRKEVINHAIELGISPNTAKSQYYYWSKAEK